MHTRRTGILEATPRPIPLSFLLDSLWNEKWFGAEHWEARSEVTFTDYWWFFATAAALYYPVIFGLRAWMKNREPYRLRVPLILWNILMTTFSSIGFGLTLYATLDSFFKGTNGPTLHYAVCRLWCFEYSGGAKALFLFNVSKTFEFMDTIFVVLRKQKLIFLHYYHHLVTMLFCWYANQYSIQLLNCGPYYFSLFNYAVHTTMYGYYALRAMGFRPKFDIVITISQIVQMVGGLTVLYHMGHCPISDQTIQMMGLLLYSSFFFLFCWFFINRYIFSSRPAPAKGSDRKTK